MTQPYDVSLPLFGWESMLRLCITCHNSMGWRTSNPWSYSLLFVFFLRRRFLRSVLFSLVIIRSWCDMNRNIFISFLRGFLYRALDSLWALSCFFLFIGVDSKFLGHLCLNRSLLSWISFSSCVSGSLLIFFVWCFRPWTIPLLHCVNCRIWSWDIVLWCLVYGLNP